MVGDLRAAVVVGDNGRGRGIAVVPGIRMRGRAVVGVRVDQGFTFQSNRKFIQIRLCDSKCHIDTAVIPA